MGADVIVPEILDWIQIPEVNFLSNGLTGLDMERFHLLRGISRHRLTIAAGNFESEPAFSAVVMQINVTSGAISNGDGGEQWFVGDVLQAAEFQLHLNLSIGRTSDEAKEQKKGGEFQRRHAGT